MEISLRIHKPDRHQRKTEVTRFLTDVSGEDAQAAGVDRQRLMNRKFRRKVRDTAAGEIRTLLLPPRIARSPHSIQAGEAWS